MANAIQQPKFQLFDKYDFVKSYVAISHSKSDEAKKEREEEAALIASAIKDTQNVLLENLATKEDIKALERDIKALELSTKADIKSLARDIKALEISTKKDIEQLKSDLTIRLTAIMAGLFTFLPLATDFIRHLLKF